MVRNCSAINCERKRDRGVTFHAFPKNEALRSKWLLSMGRNGWEPGPHNRICGQHFLNNCYENAPWTTRKRLKADAVPTIFEFSQHEHSQIICEEIKDEPPDEEYVPTSDPLENIPVQTTDKSSQNMTIDSDISYQSDRDSSPPSDDTSSQPSSSSTRKKRLIYVGDFRENNIYQYTIQDLVRFIAAAKRSCARKDHQIRILKQKVRRQHNKIKCLNSMIKCLEHT